ncbi:MAG: UDP-2,3-diacylglucosamine diphosphatase [Flavobacteriaceae bacterium]
MKIYFASDQHLGAPTMQESLVREKRFVKWLTSIEEDATALFLLGDLFDFWFEYQTVVPKGFSRTLGKLSEFSDRGIPVYFFVGNHDLWMAKYLEEECGVKVFHKPEVFDFGGKKFFIGHGDGLGPGDKGYKRMKRVFTNKVCQWAFRWFHPDLGVKLAQYLSVKNRLISGEEDVVFLGADQEWLVLYAKRKLEAEHYDYFMFGHRHLPMVVDLGQDSTYINTGDWISYFSYAVFDGDKMQLRYDDERVPDFIEA